MVQSERLLRAYLRDIRRNLKPNVFRLFRRLCRISLAAPRAVIKYYPCIRISVMTVSTFYHYPPMLAFPGRKTVPLKFLSTARRIYTADITHKPSDISFFSVIFVSAEYVDLLMYAPYTPPTGTPY